MVFMLLLLVLLADGRGRGVSRRARREEVTSRLVTQIKNPLEEHRKELRCSKKGCNHANGAVRWLVLPFSGLLKGPQHGCCYCMWTGRAAVEAMAQISLLLFSVLALQSACYNCPDAGAELLVKNTQGSLL